MDYYESEYFYHKRMRLTTRDARIAWDLEYNFARSWAQELGFKY